MRGRERETETDRDRQTREAVTVYLTENSCFYDGKDNLQKK